MNTQWTQEAIQDTIKKIIERGSTDPEFRRLALSHPNDAVEQVSGIPVPPGVKIRFVENEGAQYTVVLPDMKKADMSELSDAELEQVAGGRGICGVSCGVTSTVSATVTVAVACI
jgi:hypothetical protein